MAELSTIGQRVASERVGRIVSAVNDASPGSIRREVANAFATNAQVGLDAPWPGEAVHDGAWALRWARSVGGIRPHDVEPAGEDGVRLAVEERYPLASGEAILECSVSPDPPHLISSWWYQPLDRRPDSAISSGPPDVLLSALLDRLEAARLFSGIVLLDIDGRRILAGRGAADAAGTLAIRSSTRFNIASLTKLFTAVAVCRLAERGAIVLGSPIRRWLGHDVSDAIGRLTSDQLLRHVGGLPEQVPDVDGSASIGVDWLAPLAGIAPDSPPGSSWRYSNVGYALLGAVIERTTGLPYFTAMSELVFEPAGMVASAFADTTTADPGRALPFVYASDEALLPTPGLLDAGLGRGAPYGYAHSTVEDIDRLVRAVVEHRIVDEASAKRILGGSTPTGEPGRFAGYGMFVEEFGRWRVTTSSGAGPGVTAWLDVIPELGYRAIILANHPKPAAHRIGRFLRAQLIPAR